MTTQSRLDENTWQVPENRWTVIPPFRGHSRIRPIELDLGAASEGGGILGKYSEHFREALVDTAFHDTEVAAAVATVLDRSLVGPTMAAAHKLADKKSGDAIGDILARFPTDEAFTQLLSRIDRPYAIAPLRAAIERFPRRAMRSLAAEIPHSPTAGYLLNEHALAHPEIAAECGVQVDNRYARIAEDRLPELLRTPPWVRPRPKTRPAVVTGVGTDRPHAVAWAPGEREKWAATAVRELHYEGAQDRFWEKLIDDARKDRGWYGHVLPGLLAAGPAHVVRPHLATANHGVLHNAGPALRRLLGRFGAAAVSFVLAAAQSKPTLLADVLLPVTGTAVTSAMIRWLDSKSVRGLALSWFDRHIDTAATDLVAAALAKPGQDRRLAEAAVRTLAERGHRAALVETARSHSDKAAAALIAVLDSDPLLQLPTRMPTLPEWLTLAALPPIVLRSGEGALPDSAVGHVCTMLALCGPAGNYSGIAQVAEFADPDSLAEFAWLVFQAWRLADYPSAHGWVLHAQGLLGNDETVRRLAPLIREWPGETAHARAVNGLDVLAAIGTHEALTQLNGIAGRVKFKALKARAWERFGEVADGLGLTADELADRLVPDLGLDAAGTKVLDYGARGFIVGFDEQLKPTVSDAIRAADGHWAATTRRATLPKPGVKDDSELAPAAHKAFGALRKEAKNLAADQLRRMEAAMVRARRWSAAEHRRLLIEHPLLWHLTRRLVWATYTADGTVTGTFRVAEDRTLADPRDNPATIPDDAPVGIAHPLDLADLLGPWGEVFADYELLQPFPQLQRETYALTDTERASRTLTRFHHRTVRTERLLALHKYGWERGRPQDNGSSFWIHRPLGGGRSAVIGITPGIYIAEPLIDDEQTINQVRITAVGEEHDEYQQLTPHIFAELDRITASEMLRELETVFQ
ncbi:DUF4132 domain-containing protein [Nocardia vinacea]|uniref:DUF4132 domain-containing protein n=1 Tax=Nocardia vinacea TaxID=96468 RepID=A0ABZ1Z0I1_9NOCA|nr:DUF4132 domain-containing protein [Nocardia vinacea]